MQLHYYFSLSCFLSVMELSIMAFPVDDHNYDVFFFCFFFFGYILH